MIRIFQTKDNKIISIFFSLILIRQAVPIIFCDFISTIFDQIFKAFLVRNSANGPYVGNPIEQQFSRPQANQTVTMTS